MAASGEETLEGQLGLEATCPLCLDFFEQPMFLSCGHNLCHRCLAQLGPEPSCPQCRAKVEPGSTCPNRALANVVRLVKRRRLSEGAQEEGSGQRLCQEHGQPLQSFCSREKSLLCAGCLEGHQGHPLLSLPEAAKGYKDMLHDLLEPLRNEERKLLEQRWAEEQRRQECQELLAAEKQEVGLALESLQELLRERQPVWLGWLAEQEKMEAESEVALAKLSGEASRLQELMAQMERKCRQPDGEFLQDIQDTVDRCRSYVVGHVESISPRLQGRLRTLLENNAFVKRIVNHYKASLQATLTRENLERLLSKVCVMPNDSTAHPRLLCQGCTVTWANIDKHCPDVPGRFNTEFCVLGCEGFNTGWRWWEVSVHEQNTAPAVQPSVPQRSLLWQVKGCWAIGVAKESVRRKGYFHLSPQEGIWAVGRSVSGKMIAFDTQKKLLSWKKPLQRLRVRLDCEAKEVEFLDAETEASLHTFQVGPLLGETLWPFFYLGQKGVTLQCEQFPRPIKGLWD